MPTDDGTNDLPLRTRRKWLSVFGAGASLWLAGCGSSGGGDGASDDAGESGPASETPPAATAPDGAGDGAGGDCPTDSFSYVTRQYSAFGQSGYRGQCEVPESARIEGGGEASSENGIIAIFEWGGRKLTSIGITAQFSADPDQEGLEDPTVEEGVTAVQQNNDSTMVRATGQFENIPEGGVVLVSEETSGDDPAIPRVTTVVLDHPDGVLRSSINLNGDPDCAAASVRIHRRMVESQRPA